MAEREDPGSPPPPEPDWEQFLRDALDLGVSLSSTQTAQFQRYLDLLCEWNRRFNLTAIERPDEILLKHFLDSLTCSLVVDFSRVGTLVDVGSGAGFPGLVLKIAYPNLEVTLLDSIRKRIGFLERVIEDLELPLARAVPARAEEAARPEWRLDGGAPLREAFDLVTARAVARLNVLAEWTVPFARPGGNVLYMKGPEVEDEAAEAGRAFQLLGAGAPEVRRLTLPRSDVGRSLVRVPKLRATPPAYPRATGAARKNPLGGGPKRAKSTRLFPRDHPII